MAKEKALVLYSGGLDSRLVVKLMLEKGYDVEALHFNLPFGCGCCDIGCNLNFTQKENVKLIVIDSTKGKLLEEYLDIIKNPKLGIGKGINPCKDCKIWMFSKAKEYADEHGIKIIATGEVIGQRPMSQTKNALAKIDKEIGFKPLRPLIDLGCSGRQRTRQMEMAKKYNIIYPNPAGGCSLCDKNLSQRFKFLIENKLVNEKNLSLSKIGRHYFIKDFGLFIVGRNEKENEIIELFKNSIESDKGKPAVYFEDINERSKIKAIEIQKVFEEKKQDTLKVFKL